jgi:hypothetical protein
MKRQSSIIYKHTDVRNEKNSSSVYSPLDSTYIFLQSRFHARRKLKLISVNVTNPESGSTRKSHGS